MMDFEQFLNEEHEKGTYVSAKFSAKTNKNLKEYAESLGLDPIKDFHATIVYSIETLDLDPGKSPIKVKEKGSIVGIKYLGEKDTEWRAVVLTIKSKILKERFDHYVKAHGYKNKFPDYIQHISLAYKPPEDLKLKTIKLPSFKIEFKEEVIEHLNK
ncbi:MAG: hypothetical protein QM489_00510 [Candidatus Izemoplasma sp.]